MNGRAAGRFAAAAAAAKPLDDELSLPILLAERVRKAALEADSFKSDCADLANQVHLLADTLRSVARLSPSYDRPIRRVFAAASHSLHPALAFARRCRRGVSLLRRITAGSTDPRKIHSLLDASLADLRWLLSLYSDNNILSLPPIASTDPILSLIWSYIATVHMSASPADRAEAAANLANLALDNDRNKNIIVDEGGLPPLLSLLRDDSSTEARISAALALANLAATAKNVKLMIKEAVVPVIIAVLYDAPMRLQTRVASLVSRMAERDPDVQEEFARENACRPLVSLLSFEVPLDEPPAAAAPRSVHSLVRGIASATTSTSAAPAPRSYWERSHHRKDNENETPAGKLELKVACSEALWMLTRGCVSNSRKITETTKGLLCLAKLIERERGKLQYNCLMTIMEMASAAEMDADLRCTAFKTKSPAAKAVVDQLLVQLGSSSSPVLQIAAVKAIGSLARIFSKDTHVLSPLVGQLGHWNPDVAVEAAIALSKFACPDNFNCAEHSKGIVESGAVPQLLRLLRTGEKTKLPALTLLCHLALHAPNSEALGRYRVLGTLESEARTAVAHHPSLKELLPDSIYHLELYRGGGNPHLQLYTHGSLPL